VGLTNHLEKVGTSILVTQEATDNEAQLHRMHVPSYAALQPDSFEQVILNHYADIPFRIGMRMQRMTKLPKLLFGIARHWPSIRQCIKPPRR